MLELVQRARLRQGQQAQRGIRYTGLLQGLRSGQRALRPALRFRGQLGRPFQERGRRDQTAARSRPPGRALQLSGNLLVQPGCRLGLVSMAPDSGAARRFVAISRLAYSVLGAWGYELLIA